MCNMQVKSEGILKDTFALCFLIMIVPPYAGGWFLAASAKIKVRAIYPTRTGMIRDNSTRPMMRSFGFFVNTERPAQCLPQPVSAAEGRFPASYVCLLLIESIL